MQCLLGLWFTLRQAVRVVPKRNGFGPRRANVVDEKSIRSIGLLRLGRRMASYRVRRVKTQRDLRMEFRLSR